MNVQWGSEKINPHNVPTAENIIYIKIALTTAVLYYTIAGATKQGILLMYYRLFSVSTSFRYQLYIASVLVIGWWVGCTIAALTNCIPLEWTWRHTFADPRGCFDFSIFWMASGACEVFLDVMILFLPVSVVARMKLSPKRKLTVLGIFLLGGLYVYMSD